MKGKIQTVALLLLGAFFMSWNTNTIMDSAERISRLDHDNVYVKRDAIIRIGQTAEEASALTAIKPLIDIFQGNKKEDSYTRYRCSHVG